MSELTKSLAPSRVTVHAITHHGARRSHNEDAIAVNDWVRGASMQEIERLDFELREPVLCLVVDGMGGHAGGEQASRIAAATISRARLDLNERVAVEGCVRQANAAIYEAAAESDHLRAMGATVVGLLIGVDATLMFNVGDSRLYRFRDGYLRQMSIDDVPQSDVKAARAERSHVVTQSLGGASSFQEVIPHVDEDGALVPSDWLLCSDGLSDLVDLDEMSSSMRLGGTEAVSALFEAAMRNGGDDNISIIVVAVRGGEDGSQRL